MVTAEYLQLNQRHHFLATPCILHAGWKPWSNPSHDPPAPPLSIPSHLHTKIRIAKPKPSGLDEALLASGTFRPCRWKPYILPKRWRTSTELNGIKTQTTVLFFPCFNCCVLRNGKVIKKSCSETSYCCTILPSHQIHSYVVALLLLFTAWLFVTQKTTKHVSRPFSPYIPASLGLTPFLVAMTTAGRWQCPLRPRGPIQNLQVATHRLSNPFVKIEFLFKMAVTYLSPTWLHETAPDAADR